MTDPYTRTSMDAAPVAGSTGTDAVAARILEAREAERSRLAQDIHDGPAQALANAIFAAEYVERILTSDPDIVAIFAANDPPALGAVQALKAAGRDDVIVVGFDGTEAGLEAVKNGDLAADVLQFPDAMGIIGVDLMVRHLNGEEIPENVDSGSGLATPENVDQYLG